MQGSISTKKIAGVGLFAALTLLATSVLKIPTPTFGYIHIGDGFVLLAGFLLGPLYGALAAGIGSALSDLLGGYVVWVPGTFAIKFLTALVAAHAFLHLSQGPRKNVLSGASSSDGLQRSSLFKNTGSIVLAGIAGELVMVLGYFLYNILIVSLASGDANVGFFAAAGISLAEIPFNLIQGTAGILLSSALYPVVSRAANRFLRAA